MSRSFWLDRREDASGVSGTGTVAEGFEFSDGHCALRWLTETSSTAFYDSLADVVSIHGHEGKTIVVFEVPDVR